MKKVTKVLLLFLLLVSCRKVEDIGKFEGVVSWNVNLDSDRGTYKAFIIDDKLALEIGNAIIKRIYGEEILKDTNYIVCESKEKECFVLSRVSRIKGVVGNEYCVAINKSDGKILRVWVSD